MSVLCYRFSFSSLTALLCCGRKHQLMLLYCCFVVGREQEEYCRSTEVYWRLKINGAFFL